MKSSLTWMWIGVGLAAVGIWFLILTVHGMAEEAQPKWKIVVTLDGPPGKQELTYGNQLSGVHWFKSQAECEDARKNDKDLAKAMLQVAKMKAELAKQRVPIDVTVACVMDNSV